MAPRILRGASRLGAVAAVSSFDSPSPMIIIDLNVFRTCIAPAENDSPLVIDPDRVPASEVAAEGFESVARHDAQITERLGYVECSQLAARRLDQVSRKPFRTDTVEHWLGRFTFEAPDHDRPPSIVSQIDT